MMLIRVPLAPGFAGVLYAGQHPRTAARRTRRSTSGPNSIPACLAASGRRLRGREARKGVDFQKIRLVGRIQHDVDPGQVARSHGVVGAGERVRGNSRRPPGGRPVSNRCSVSVERYFAS